MRRVLGAVGRVLVTVGLLLLLFVAYQLWGTGIYQARAQNNLEQQFNQSLEQAEASPTTDHHARRPRPRPRPTTDDHARAAHRCPRRATRSARIGIPKIGVDQYVVEGVERRRPAQGARATTRAPRSPGHEGNSAIAGHRTTYGAPFGDLDQLDAGRRRSPS